MSAKISDALAAGIDKVRHVLLADDNATNDRARTANPRAKTIHSERISYAGPGTVTVGVPCLTRPFAGLQGGVASLCVEICGATTIGRPVWHRDFLSGGGYHRLRIVSSGMFRELPCLVSGKSHRRDDLVPGQKARLLEHPILRIVMTPW